MNGTHMKTGGSFAASLFVVVLLIAGGVGVVPGVSYAQYAEDGGCCDYSYEPVSDYSYNPTDYSYDPVSDYSYNPVDYSYDPISDYSYNPTDYSYDPVNDYSYDPIRDYSYDPVNDYSYDPIRDYSYDPTHDYSYDPTYDYSYNPTHDDYATFVDDYHYVDSEGAVYTYSTPVGTSYSVAYPSHTSYSTPKFTVPSPKVSFKTVPIAYPVTIAKPAKTTTSYNIDNSVNDSFNVVDSYNVTTVTKVADKQSLIQYVYPPSCTIYATPGSSTYANQASVLTWTSQNAYSAYLSSVGSVGTSGSYSVYPSQTTTYTMTVYDASGRAGNCQTTVYVAPQPPVTQYPSCTLQANPSYIQNGAYSILSWTSYNATSASLSDGLGTVVQNGSLSVRPESNRAYTLTVRDSYGRTATCNAFVSVSGSYISLSQIPYTGFDFGPFGNSLYWLLLALLAGGAAYLVLFYRGGVVNVLQETVGLLMTPVGHVGMASRAETREEKTSVSFKNDARIHVEDLPIRQYEAPRATRDTMSVVASKAGEAPRIIISRE